MDSFCYVTKYWGSPAVLVVTSQNTFHIDDFVVNNINIIEQSLVLNLDCFVRVFLLSELTGYILWS